jgi:hypothetical protein
MGNSGEYHGMYWLSGWWLRALHDLILNIYWSLDRDVFFDSLGMVGAIEI